MRDLNASHSCIVILNNRTLFFFCCFFLFLVIKNIVKPQFLSFNQCLTHTSLSPGTQTCWPWQVIPLPFSEIHLKKTNESNTFISK